MPTDPTHPPRLSVVCPAYNEQGAIADTVADVVRHVFPLVPECELIVVNDGSRDRTGAILNGLASEEPRLRVIHQPNAGHGPAIRRGMEEAAGSRIFLIDSDRQMPLEHFPALWAAAQDHDAAFGIRSQRDDPRLRLILTRIIRACVRLLFGTPLKDLNVPFKIFTREVWEGARTLIPPDTLAPSLFLSIIAHRQGRTIAQVPVPHRPRETGVVSIRRWKLLKFCARAFRQLLALWWHLPRR